MQQFLTKTILKVFPVYKQKRRSYRPIYELIISDQAQTQLKLYICLNVRILMDTSLALFWNSCPLLQRVSVKNDVYFF